MCSYYLMKGTPTIINSQPFNMRVDLENSLYLETSVNISVSPGNKIKSNIASSQFVGRYRFYFLGGNGTVSVDFIFMTLNRAYGGTGNFLVAGDGYRVISYFPFYLINRLSVTNYSKNISFS